MEAFYTSTRVVDFILVLVAIETVVLVALHRRTGWGIPPRVLVPNTLSGVFLLLALRCALVQAEWFWLAACLLGALLAHLRELWTRAVPLPATAPRPR